MSLLFSQYPEEEVYENGESETDQDAGDEGKEEPEVSFLNNDVTRELAQKWDFVRKKEQDSGKDEDNPA